MKIFREWIQRFKDKKVMKEILADCETWIQAELLFERATPKIFKHAKEVFTFILIEHGCEDITMSIKKNKEDKSVVDINIEFKLQDIQHFIEASVKPESVEACKCKN